VDPVAITLSGVLYNDPRPFTTGSGAAGVSLFLELPPSGRGSGDSKSRYVKVVAFGTLAGVTAGTRPELPDVCHVSTPSAARTRPVLRRPQSLPHRPVPSRPPPPAIR
jgi:hypothetical protein